MESDTLDNHRQHTGSLAEINDEDSSDSEEIPETYKLRGNEAWKNGDVDKAISEWQYALKLCLKYSVKGVCNRRSIDLQVDIRLNLSLAYLKKEEYTKVIENCDYALLDNPNNVKALYRKASAYLGLQEWNSATEMCLKILNTDQNNKDARKILSTIQYQKSAHEKREKLLFKNMFRSSFKTNISSSPISASAIVPNMNFEGQGTTGSVDRIVHVCDKLWDTHWLVEDFDQTIWEEAHNIHFLRNTCNYSITRGLPLTILYGLCRVYFLHYDLYCANLKYDFSETKNFSKNDFLCSSSSVASSLECHYGILKDLRKKTFIIHIIGAVGNHEMQCKFTTILKRVPYLENLIIIFIGFLDSDTEFTKKLKKNELSDPLVIQVNPLQKQVSMLYKGYYHDFIEKYPEVLTNDTHSFHPDLCFIGNPNFPKDFHLWQKSLIPIIEANLV